MLSPTTMGARQILVLCLGLLFSPGCCERFGAVDVDFDVVEANKTLHLAWSAYCNETALQAWDCEWCTGPNSIPNVNLVKYLKNKEAGTQGFVGIDNTRKRVVVAYRGSKNFENTVQDAEFWMTRFGPSGVKVDHGFLSAYMSVRNETLVAVKAALNTCSSSSDSNKPLSSDCRSVLFTGHSLGAAMATIGAAEVAAKDDSIFANVEVNLFTFGSPRVGNKEFVAWATSNLIHSGTTRKKDVGRVNNSTVAALAGSGSLRRMRREKDIVPSIPPRSIGYRHMPTEVWNRHNDSDNSSNNSYVLCNGSGEDPNCGDQEERPFFPLYLLHLSGAEHTRYMGYQGGGCTGGHDN